VRPPGTLGYASYFATWLLFVTFLSLADYRMEKERWWRRAAVVAVSLATVSIILTGTRAAILALVAGGVVWAFFQGVRVSRRQVAVAGAGLAALAVLYYSPPGQQLRSRTRWFVEDPWGGARLDLWRDSLRMAAHRLPAGYGPEVFTAEFPRYESAALARSYPDFAHESPHNMFLDAFVSQGIPGLAILLLLCADGLLRAWRLRAPPFAAALAAGVVSQQFTAFTMPTALVFFTTLALLAALEASPAKSPEGKPLPGLYSAPLAVLAACVLLYLSFRFAVSDHALAQAQQGLDNENLQVAANAYRRYEHWRLPGGSADLWYSRRLLNIALNSKNPLTGAGAMLQSESAARKATASAEDPFNAWYNLAVIFGLHNNGPHAAECLRAAMAANPNWYKPHWTLAEVLLAQGQIAEARAQAELAFALDSGKHAEVTNTLARIRSQFRGVRFPGLQR
jgi:tetratricopeptide (TPR) repeat protein